MKYLNKILNDIQKVESDNQHFSFYKLIVILSHTPPAHQVHIKYSIQFLKIDTGII
ncbi:hypothetical protein PPL_04008 [Heterostelium album PN500]|uniref:Uncharacterized protein n=1 Tax=Heterostelium pallidum (strain ATCC 26659 / Pp 5 / PN500) TaxID=670386 RepID=D3B5S0_HETP5|nr:hypothetical protein PPL_04008 [Heterostelium album PN500]EFA83218.1 hypothetical protein PPL_04008 [Heterostelium album PN500]|eukprot:XP_020435335.1 hypothetical protein PPL_04008 [Heterostelium album PN500]